MSICLNDRNGCATCCGVFNLCVSRTELKQLLTDRTRSLEAIGTTDHVALVHWREGRESLEAGIARHDPSVYVCPFAGWMDGRRPGCLIHPVRTGVERSQNASFYGTTICQAYECPAREDEGKPQGMGARLRSVLAGLAEEGDPLSYGRLAGDALLFRFYEYIERSSHRTPSFWMALFRLRLRCAAAPTSFELPVTSCPTLSDYLDWLFPGEERMRASDLLQEPGRPESVDGMAAMHVLNE